MNGFWKSVLSTMIAAAIIAGASGLVLSKVTAQEVADLKYTVEQLEARDRESAAKVERIDEKVAATKESVERIEQKLDRLLDRTNPHPR